MYTYKAYRHNTTLLNIYIYCHLLEYLAIRKKKEIEKKSLPTNPFLGGQVTTNMIFIYFGLTIWTHENPCICMLIYNFYSYFVDITQDLLGPKRTRIPEKTESQMCCLGMSCDTWMTFTFTHHFITECTTRDLIEITI